MSIFVEEQSESCPSSGLGGLLSVCVDAISEAQVILKLERPFVVYEVDKSSDHDGLWATVSLFHSPSSPRLSSKSHLSVFMSNPLASCVLEQ